MQNLNPMYETRAEAYKAAYESWSRAREILGEGNVRSEHFHISDELHQFTVYTPSMSGGVRDKAIFIWDHV